MGLVEGDFIETVDGLIFAVKGSSHPRDGYMAYLRYIPCRNGDRVRESDRRRYRKVYPIATSTYKYLARKFPVYVRDDFQIVPFDKVKRVYRPEDKLCELMKSSRDSKILSNLRSMVNFFVEGGIPLRKLGVSGSLLIGLKPRKGTDLDIYVYGRKYCIKASEILDNLIESGLTRRPSESFLSEVYARLVEYPPNISLEEFLWHFSRKNYFGVFRGQDFCIFGVKDRRTQLLRKPNIVCRVSGDFTVRESSGLVVPAEYKTREGLTIVSHSIYHRQQAFKGERASLSGILEKYGSDYRVILCSRKNQRMEYLRVIHR